MGRVHDFIKSVFNHACNMCKTSHIQVRYDAYNYTPRIQDITYVQDVDITYIYTGFIVVDRLVAMDKMAITTTILSMAICVEGMVVCVIVPNAPSFPILQVCTFKLHNPITLQIPLREQMK